MKVQSGKRTHVRVNHRRNIDSASCAFKQGKCHGISDPGKQSFLALRKRSWSEIRNEQIWYKLECCCDFDVSFLLNPVCCKAGRPIWVTLPSSLSSTDSFSRNILLRRQCQTKLRARQSACPNIWLFLSEVFGRIQGRSPFDRLTLQVLYVSVLWLSVAIWCFF